MTPEQKARAEIDRLLELAGWVVQDFGSTNLYAARGVAVREFPLKSGHGTADYLLYVDQKAVGVVEAKPAGFTLTGVEAQSEKYSTGLPDGLTAPRRPLPFVYESTGVETQFTNGLDPEPAAAWPSLSIHPRLWPSGLGHQALLTQMQARSPTSKGHTSPHRTSDRT